MRSGLVSKTIDVRFAPRKSFVSIAAVCGTLTLMWHSSLETITGACGLLLIHSMFYGQRHVGDRTCLRATDKAIM